MVHILDKAGLYREVLRVLKPGGWFLAANWLWAKDAETSAVVQAWLSRGPLKFAFTTPRRGYRGDAGSGIFGRVGSRQADICFQESKLLEVEALTKDRRANALPQSLVKDGAGVGLRARSGDRAPSTPAT